MTFAEIEGSVEGADPIELYRFAQSGGQVWLFTGTEEPVTFNLETYEPAIISSTAADESQEDLAGAKEILVPRNHPVALEFVRYLPVRRIAVTIYELMGDPDGDHEAASVWLGEVISCSFDDSEARLACAPISEALRRPLPGLMFQALCNWPLYGAGCGVNRHDHVVATTVDSIDGAVVSAAAFAEQPDGHFNNGWLELANGDVRWILDHTGTDLVLMSAFLDLEPGAAVQAFPGCPRTWTACRDKFGNDQFSGFDLMPELNPFNTRIS